MYGINVNGKLLDNLKFADDIVLILESDRAELQRMVTDLERESERVKLKISKEKTKYMTNAEGTGQLGTLQMEEGETEEVSEYTYLDNIVSFKDRRRKN